MKHTSMRTVGFLLLTAVTVSGCRWNWESNYFFYGGWTDEGPTTTSGLYIMSIASGELALWSYALCGYSWADADCIAAAAVAYATAYEEPGQQAVCFSGHRGLCVYLVGWVLRETLVTEAEKLNFRTLLQQLWQGDGRCLRSTNFDPIWQLEGFQPVGICQQGTSSLPPLPGFL